MPSRNLPPKPDGCSGGGRSARSSAVAIEDLGSDRMLDALDRLLGFGGPRLGGPRSQLGSGQLSFDSGDTGLRALQGLLCRVNPSARLVHSRFGSTLLD